MTRAIPLGRRQQLNRMSRRPRDAKWPTGSVLNPQPERALSPEVAARRDAIQRAQREAEAEEQKTPF